MRRPGIGLPSFTRNSLAHIDNALPRWASSTNNGFGGIGLNTIFVVDLFGFWVAYLK